MLRTKFEQKRQPFFPKAFKHCHDLDFCFFLNLDVSMVAMPIIPAMERLRQDHKF